MSAQCDRLHRRPAATPKAEPGLAGERERGVRQGKHVPSSKGKALKRLLLVSCTFVTCAMSASAPTSVKVGRAGSSISADTREQASSSPSGAHRNHAPCGGMGRHAGASGRLRQGLPRAGVNDLAPPRGSCSCPLRSRRGTCPRNALRSSSSAACLQWAGSAWQD